MKIVWFEGGLGNQMFQYAFLRSLKNKYPSEIILADINSFTNYNLHNGFELSEIFDLKFDFCTRTQLRKIGYDQNFWFHKLKRRFFGFKPTVFLESEKDKYSFSRLYTEYRKDCFYIGYWQCPKYFNPISEQIKIDFSFNPNLNKKNTELLRTINASNSISVHVRRGDYTTHPLFGGICDEEYYKKAFTKIQTLKNDLKYFIFCDDKKWLRQNLFIQNATYVDWNTDKSSYIDMYLMSKCKHNIIANSSFSWWAAYLNSNDDKVVIAPSKWKNNMIGTRELIPESWLQV